MAVLTERRSGLKGIRLGHASYAHYAAFMLAASAFLSAPALQLAGQTRSASEYQVKAAYLYNFAKLTEWPAHILPNGESRLVIGVVGGDDEFIDTLRKTIAGRSVGTHAITVKRASSEPELQSCHLLFFRSSGGAKRTEGAISTATAGVLLVGEEDGFLQHGGMINLVLKNGTVRFEVDQASLDRANIHLNPELLALARTAGGRTPEPSEEARRVRVSTPPEYPEMAMRMHIRGAVQVEASVLRNGTVSGVRVIGGHPLLAAALVKAVKGWQYAPAAKDSVVVVRFVFDP